MSQRMQYLDRINVSWEEVNIMWRQCECVAICFTYNSDTRGGKLKTLPRFTCQHLLCHAVLSMCMYSVYMGVYIMSQNSIVNSSISWNISRGLVGKRGRSRQRQQDYDTSHILSVEDLWTKLLGHCCLNPCWASICVCCLLTITECKTGIHIYWLTEFWVNCSLFLI